jgi:hypothetical protein
MRKTQRLLADIVVLLLYFIAGLLLLGAAIAGSGTDPLRVVSLPLISIGCLYLARSIREEQKLAPP